MKKFVAILLVLTVVLIGASTAQAQLGDLDTSQVTVQNVSGDVAQVTIQFFAEDGAVVTPICLDGSNPCTFTNPFSLNDGESKQILAKNVPGLSTGRYSVVVSSTGEVVAMSGAGSSGTTHFNGAYSGFSNGGNPVYLPSVNFNYYGTWGMVSVMNLGTAATDITLEITCNNVALVGTLTAVGVPQYSSHTFVLKNETPTGFSGTTACQGSGKLTASPDQPIATVNLQNNPTQGNTLVFEGAPSGFDTLYLPQLQVNNFNWNSVISIQKLNSGNTTVTVDYSDAEASDTCNLTDAAPSCQLVLKDEHPTSGRFSATVTSSPSNELLVQVGNTKKGHATEGAFANAYLGFSSGSGVVAVPGAQKNYYGWVSAINCMNITTTPTELEFAFQGVTNVNNPYNPGVELDQGESVQVHTTSDLTLAGMLPDGYYGGVTVTALASGAEIVCTVGNGNPTYNATKDRGDWNNMYNAPNR
jgi:hypothetical protein